MAVRFTPAQQKVLDARNHNILVSAAAGSGKTAVLVERIVRLCSEGEKPLDIDRLLVVTFTRAAAAQMRERIGQALAARLEKDPRNAHLQAQEVLLHSARITTMDSFFTFLLRNYFSDIDLDPAFRQIDPAESRLIAAEVMEDFLEEKYEEKDPAFLHCVDFFCHGTEDSRIEELISALCEQAGSHPSPEQWLRDRAGDYDVPDEAALFATPWMRSLVLRAADRLLESDLQYAAMESICTQPGGPDTVLPFLSEERQGMFGTLRSLYKDIKEGEEIGTPQLSLLWEEIQRALAQEFGRYPSPRGKKYDYMDPALKDAVKAMRDAEKNRIVKLRGSIGGQSTELVLAAMAALKEPVQTLSALSLEYLERFSQVKKDRGVIDFIDLEHCALDILAERQPDGSYVPRRAAKALRSRYAEILIDEYQDSNEVQELLLQIISGEDEGHYNRFMVGDIKQSIYRFRLARPEIFMEKYDTYRPDDPRTERIELDQNFRSRGEVLDCVNAVFMRLMRREVGGVAYSERVSLKKGAVFPEEDGLSSETQDPETQGLEAQDPDTSEEAVLISEPRDPETPEEAVLSPETKDPETTAGSSPSGMHGASVSGARPSLGPSARTSPYTAELLLLDTGGSASAGDGEGEGEADQEDTETEEDGIAVLGSEIGTLSDRQKEALLIAGRIRDLVGKLPVRDEETGKMRPARYGDIVILLRSTVRWNEDIRAVFAREGIPVYAESRTGYFAAEEIRQVLEMLRIMDNPRQDIPLYGALRGYFGGFTQDEITLIRLAKRDGLLYDALCAAAGSSFADPAVPEGMEDAKRPAESGPEIPPALEAKCADFLRFLDQWRRRTRYSSVAELITGLLEETGYTDYCTALPAGTQRSANLRVLRSQADAFTKTDYTGLFQFLRYIEGLKKQEIDLGEANTLDENADVVRIMSIHKSKGLEFPVCFVAGLSGGFSFRRFDASGPMIFDGDWGAGIHYYDPASRVRATTLRREEIAEKIRRDCMGEELRVLYVALTRAKEKLIMTASGRDLAGKIEAWKTKMSGFFQQEKIRKEEQDPSAEGTAEPSGAYCRQLSPSMIVAASGYTELICEAIFAGAGEDAFAGAIACKDGPEDPAKTGPDGRPAAEDPAKTGPDGRPAAEDPAGAAPFDAGPAASSSAFCKVPGFPLAVRIFGTDDLTMHAASDQLDLSGIDGMLRAMEGHPLDEQPDPAAAQELADRFFRVYPHEELRDLYAQTSVSELKHRAMEAGTGHMEEGDPEVPAELFPEPLPVPYLPAFIRKEEPAAGGARRGTAFHRALECLDYRRLTELTGKNGSGEILAQWIRSLTETGKMTQEDAALVNMHSLRAFLQSPLAERMAAADKRGQLFREQPFVLGCAADRLREDFPHDETITVQGIIDAFFLEEDGIILVDYKTDRVQREGDLIHRYSIQLALYAEALEKAFRLPVTEKIIYSTALQSEIRL